VSGREEASEGFVSESTKPRQPEDGTRGKLAIPVGMMEQLEITEMESWIDDAGYTRRHKMRILMGEAMTIDMDMRMFDFNSDISINPPEQFLD